MKIKELKELLKEFQKSLDNKDADEWYGTDREICQSFSKRLLFWCNKNRKKIEQIEVK